MINNPDISPAVLRILKKRGITEEKDIEEYMSPVPRRTYDPFLMKGMDEVSDTVIDYAKSGKKICVYGDYDADGVTSVTLMMTLLGELGADAWYYIPSRFDEGYGLNKTAIDTVAARGTKLIITVDNGCVAFDEIAYIKEKGMSVIITDHHNTAEDRTPDCLMLDPKQPGDDYPFSYLCGCGVAFKLAQAITRKTGISKKKLNSMLDLVGIATVGDIVPLVDENRTLVKYGLDRIRRNERTGIAALLETIKMKPQTVSSYNIAFGIVPHINSCGRMARADTGVKLLTESSSAQAAALAAACAEYNTERKRLQEEIFKEAAAWAEAQPDIPEFILYCGKDAHEGVTGIVAGKLKEKYNRPSVIVTDSGDGNVKGTGRSITGVDLHGLLSRYSGLFSRFGGHAGACGFTMRSDDVDLLRTHLIEDMKALLAEKPDLFDNTLETDDEIDADDVTLELARDIGRMEPFGEGNRRPVFRVRNVTVRSVRAMGAEGQFRKFSCISASGRTFDAVCFDQDIKGLDSVKPGICLDMSGEIGENTWNGRTSVQLILRGL